MRTALKTATPPRSSNRVRKTPGRYLDATNDSPVSTPLRKKKSTPPSKNSSPPTVVNNSSAPVTQNSSNVVQNPSAAQNQSNTQNSSNVQNPSIVQNSHRNPIVPPVHLDSNENAHLHNENAEEEALRRRRTDTMPQTLQQQVLSQGQTFQMPTSEIPQQMIQQQMLHPQMLTQPYMSPLQMFHSQGFQYQPFQSQQSVFQSQITQPQLYQPQAYYPQTFQSQVYQPQILQPQMPQPETLQSAHSRVFQSSQPQILQSSQQPILQSQTTTVSTQDSAPSSVPIAEDPLTKSIKFVPFSGKDELFDAWLDSFISTSKQKGYGDAIETYVRTKEKDLRFTDKLYSTLSTLIPVDIWQKVKNVRGDGYSSLDSLLSRYRNKGETEFRNLLKKFLQECTWEGDDKAADYLSTMKQLLE
jgi:hypothetical protein